MIAIPACFSFFECARLLAVTHLGVLDLPAMLTVTLVVFKKHSWVRVTREVENPGKNNIAAADPRAAVQGLKFLKKAHCWVDL
jgi:hypothetical protein